LREVAIWLGGSIDVFALMLLVAASHS